MAMVESILKKYHSSKRDQLIPILQAIQEAQGFLSRESIIRVGEFLNLPVSKIYGVATFYNQFRFKAIGKYHVMICRGTACHVKGSKSILELLEENLQIKAGDTSRDGLFSIEVVACIGACGLAPVISINGEFHGHLTKEKLITLLDECRKNK
ncbi:MAG: NADH-quinone oxidoreductase subunit NuoE [Oligoflexia bacterium]|nr:NADH-quinone oxidoreductase subunit NuoE [Oligoflexia bacterium]MBF0366465.1 NADH-quinone oxidoreductase subunit NuoE [Oligoflexia bacterium]